MIDIQKIRADFPILAQEINEKPLAYLDNAATSQKPKQVIEALTHYYELIMRTFTAVCIHLQQERRMLMKQLEVK